MRQSTLAVLTLCASVAIAFVPTGVPHSNCVLQALPANEAAGLWLTAPAILAGAYAAAQIVSQNADFSTVEAEVYKYEEGSKAPAPAATAAVVVEEEAPIPLTEKEYTYTPAPSPAGFTPTKTTTQLVQEVGMTKAKNMEMNERAEQKKAAAAAAAPPAPTPVEEEAPKKRSLARKVFRVTKKVVAPWRKWENIS